MDGIDAYIWQRRIHHGVRLQKHAVPFPESVEIGLEFNAALERKEKLDLCLLTNAVMLELCDFAKTVTKSEAYFLFEMLEFNFDLGLDVDNDFQCYEYGRRVHNGTKLLKEQIKLKPHIWKETFPVPDRKTIMGFTGSAQSGRYHPKRNKIVGRSALTDSSKNSQSVENQETGSNGAASGASVTKNRGGVGVNLTGDGYPLCRQLGVTLTVRPDDSPEQKLDPNLITNGVMMELLDFSRVLSGRHAGIVYDLVKQNFGLELVKTQFRVLASKLMERKNACLTAEDRDAFGKEPFNVQTKKREQDCKKRKNPDADYQEPQRLTMASKRRGTPRHRDDDEKEVCRDVDLSYMCPVDFETDTEARPEKMKFESCLSGTAAETKLPVSLDAKRQEEEAFVPDLFSEDKPEDMNVKTMKQKLWVRRATRSKQILKSSKVNDTFARCREIGLDFNVGSGNKQKVHLRLLTNCVLWEVYKFAAAMTKSLRSFLFDILDNNFNLVLHDEVQRRNFMVYIIRKEKILGNHADRQEMEFLRSPFQFPEIYNMFDVTCDFHTGRDAETEQQQTDWDPTADKEPHPFCDKLGLSLWSTERRPASQKLDLTALTTGAVLEVFSFIRELCGATRETVHDILEHNFDLDLQGGDTEAARVVERWCATQKRLMKKQNASSKISRWLSMVVPLNGHPQLAPPPPTGNRPEDLGAEESNLGAEMGASNGPVRKVKRFNSYHICKEIGLKLSVGSKAKARNKLDLRVLTRGVLFEIHQYVARNCRRYVPALYEILERNFDLSSQNHRKVEFAWSIASQVMAMAGKNGRKGDYLKKVFELPFEVSESSQIVCKEEPEDGFSELDLNDNSDVAFVRELKPVDIEVEIE